MFSTPLFRLGASVFFAAIPIIVWLVTILRKEEKNKKIMILVFGLGCLTAPALLGLQILWDKYPDFNLVNIIENATESYALATIFVLLLFATMEEIIKLFMVKTVDEKTLIITKINDAIKYSIASALGFSFTENVYYLYEFWNSVSTNELFGMYIFRSIFTTSAHIFYSGIFGYYYGVGKFSIQINEQKQIIAGKKDRVGAWISKLFNLPLSEGFRQKLVIKGLLLALSFHFTINYLLELQMILPVILLNVSAYLFLQYLLNRKAGHLIMTIDPSTKKVSSIAKKDEEVVVELVGMWFKDKRYVDVLHICERLLERDPDNQVIKIFKAKALDSMDQKNVYRKILGTMIKSKEDLSDNDKNIINKYTTEKEMFQKVKNMIKERLKKEGRTFLEVKKEAPKNEITQPENTKTDQQKHDVLNQYTGDGTFDIKL